MRSWFALVTVVAWLAGLALPLLADRVWWVPDRSLPDWFLMNGHRVAFTIAIIAGSASRLRRERLCVVSTIVLILTLASWLWAEDALSITRVRGIAVS
jgi:hypothetical protein